MKRITPFWILVAGWLVFVLYAYPGYMTPDGVDQLVDSRVGEFTDWYSPMMTEVWRIVGRVISGPAGMLCLQSLLLLCGSYQLLRRVMSDRAAAIASVCVLVFPPIAATMAVISPEAQLAGFLVAGSAALASERLRIRIVGLGLFVIACGMRDGAAIAALPIIVAAFRWTDHASQRQRVVLALAAWLVVTLAGCGLSRLFVDARSQRTEVALAMSDIVGTLRYASAMQDDEILSKLDGVRLASSTEIQHHATAIYGKESSYAAKDQRLFDPPVTDADRDSLIAARRALARSAPGAYLRHRWHVFTRVLGLAKSNNWRPAHTEFIAPGTREAVHFAAWHSSVQSALIRPVHYLARTFLFKPHLYAILSLVLLVFASVRREWTAIVLLASGLFYELSLMFVTIRPEYRLSHWMIVATVLGLIVVVARRAKLAPA